MQETQKEIHTILIANRGEIALRAIRTIKEMEKKGELLWEKEAVIGSMKWIQNP